MSVTLAVSADQLSKTALSYIGTLEDENAINLCVQDRYKRAGIPKGEGNLMWQSVQFGAHSSPTELTGLGYDTIGLTTQTVDFGATYSWHAVIWPALISVFEEEQNAGGVKIYDIAKTRLDNVMGEAMRRKEAQILSGGQTGYSALTSLNGVDNATGIFEGAVPASQTHSIGGLSRVTYGVYPGWSHGYGNVAGAYASNGEATWRSAVYSSRLLPNPVDCIFSSVQNLANHNRALGTHEIFAKDEVSGRTVTKWHGIDSEVSYYMPHSGITTGTTATAGSEISAYALNLKKVPLVTLGSNSLRFLGWKDVPDKPIKVAMFIDISQICPSYMGSSFMIQGADEW